MKNLIFVHVHRTGGSSVWHNLVPLATQAGWGICDIYHQSKLAYGIPIRVQDVLTGLREKVGEKACLFHHHTTEPIRSSFDDSQTIYATVLRDPVDRLVSLVYHIRELLQSPETPPAYAEYYGQLCGEEFCRRLTKPDVKIEELLEVAATQTFFASYYTQLFYSLCHSAEPDPVVAMSPGKRRKLAEETRRMFAVIGWFSDLELAFSRIVQTFGIGQGSDRMQVTINRAERRPPLLPFVRRRYERLLESEYDFVDQLNVDNFSGVSKAA